MPTSTQSSQPSEKSQKSPVELRQLLLAVLSGLKNASKQQEVKEPSHLQSQPKENLGSEKLQQENLGPDSRMRMSNSTLQR
jgi:hypothetical protein